MINDKLDNLILIDFGFNFQSGYENEIVEIVICHIDLINNKASEPIK